MSSHNSISVNANLDEKERQAFRTTRKEHVVIDALDAIDQIIQAATLTPQSYKDMFFDCLNDITFNPAWDVYIPDEGIDPDVEVAEEMPKQADIKDN